MTALPVILRELRAEGRRPSNYYLRLIGAACATLCFALLMLDQQQGRSRALGSDLFYALNAVQFGVIALAVPILTAD